ncbi:lytic transglycosylase domain-containing protein [Sphingorhabdus sp.]|uniref:lytic transglycosylase domain-containing protein n=1 Tax=Sphingorhabdus sp. TaxID=1902408 RepID=UPI003C7337C8
MARFADAGEQGMTVQASLRFGALALFASVSTAAFAGTTTSDDFRVPSDPFAAIPGQLSAKEKQEFGTIFSAIRNKQWSEATKLIDAAPKNPMAAVARAELFVAPDSPKVSAQQIEALLNQAPWLPQAEQLATMAQKRGAASLPDRPGTRKFSWRGSAARRELPETTSGAANLRAQIQQHIKNDAPSEAERVLEAGAAGLSDAALTELRYRVAWSFYIENDDANARRVAATARAGGGEWGVQSEWVHGLASWRLGDRNDAFRSFDCVAQRAENEELRAAGWYWSARAAMAAKQPAQVQTRLQQAAQFDESFYGLIASEALGMTPIAARSKPERKAGWDILAREDNVRAAIGLAQIGHTDLAEEAVRHQAKIGDSRQHDSLARLAGAINLPSTQLWLGHYGPSREAGEWTVRYPRPQWTPSGGWRVDSSLVYAHTLQESQFKTSVVSPAGARGLMQVRPGTAQDMARDRGISFAASELDRPTTNLEYGQSYLEKLRDMNATGGLLPKVIAAYNAGPAPVTRWNSEVRDNGDPLLFIESIPYWETRGYVSTVLRNYWMYEIEAGKSGGSTAGLAQLMWPKFPDGTRSVAVRLNGNNGRLASNAQTPGPAIGVSSVAAR